MEYQLTIGSEDDIVNARSVTRQVTQDLGFMTVEQVRLVICVTELARNILLYAGKGRIRLETMSDSGKKGIKLCGEDSGPGINDPWLATLDGYSTSNGLGKGLPTIKRLMDEFELKSSPGGGTKVTVRKWLAE